MSAGQPAQQGGTVSDLLGGQWRRRGLQPVGQRGSGGDHPRGVFDHLTHIGEHSDQPVLHLADPVRIGDAIDVHVHP